jgi:succinate dehydrogenase/fumarate reductase flavoprotein subunit
VKRWCNLFTPLFLAGLLFFNGSFIPGCGRGVSERSYTETPLSGDVIIIGNTIDALIAALEAARQGAAVLVFSKESSEDHWPWTEGVAALVDEEPENGEAAYSLKEWFSLHGGGKGQEWFYDLLAGQIKTDLEWFSGEIGATWLEGSPYLLSPGNLSLPQLQERLEAAAGLEGVRFFKGTDVEEILFEERSGAAMGIRFKEASGKDRVAYAPALILADGGILGHEELVQTLAPAVISAPWRRSQSGWGWELCLDLGLDLVEPNLFAYAPAFKEDEGWVEAKWPEKALLLVDDSIIPVAGREKEALVSALLENQSGAGYLIIAEAQLRAEEEQELNWPRFAGIDSFLEAYQLDLPQLRRWYSQPWGDFRARPVQAIAEYCLGGFAVNEHGQLLRKGKPVSGLYGVGEITGGLHGTGLAPGAALAEAIVFGRYVGREAALQSQQ